MEKFIVYKIANVINGKLYFGITKCSIKKRWIQHRCNSTRKKYHLYRAMVKYGIENFNISVVKECDSEKEMYDLEKELIKLYKTTDNSFGYNNSTGGEVSSTGRVVSQNTKLKISNAQKGIKRKSHSSEVIAKMKLAAKGRDMSKLYTKSAELRRGKPAKNIVPVFSTDSNGNKKYYSSITDASKKTGISVTSISNNLNGLSKTAGKLIWDYQQAN